MMALVEHFLQRGYLPCLFDCFPEQLDAVVVEVGWFNCTAGECAGTETAGASLWSMFDSGPEEELTAISMMLVQWQRKKYGTHVA